MHPILIIIVRLFFVLEGATIPFSAQGDRNAILNTQNIEIDETGLRFYDFCNPEIDLACHGIA